MGEPYATFEPAAQGLHPLSRMEALHRRLQHCREFAERIRQACEQGRLVAGERRRLAQQRLAELAHERSASTPGCSAYQHTKPQARTA